MKEHLVKLDAKEVDELKDAEAAFDTLLAPLISIPDQVFILIDALVRRVN